MEQFTRHWYSLLLVIGLILGLGVMSRGVEIVVEGGPRMEQAELALGQTALALQQTSYAAEMQATERALQFAAQNPTRTPPTAEEQARLTATSLAAGRAMTELEIQATAARGTSYALQTTAAMLQTQPPSDAAQVQTATAAADMATAVVATQAVIYTAWALPEAELTPTAPSTPSP